MRHKVKMLLVVMAMVTYPWQLWAADPTQDLRLKWSLPTTYENRDVLPASDLVNIKVKHGTQTGIWPDITTMPTVTNYLVKDVPVGTHFFVVTVTTKNGKESGPSNEVSYTVIDDRIGSPCSPLMIIRER